jgi:putative N6-adenine-specific DNA methylase
MLTANSLKRRLKKRILNSRHRFFAVCAPGFEAALAAEVKTLSSVNDVTIERGGVEFSGPIGLLYEANLSLNTAHRVLMRIKTFSARSFPMVFDQLRRIEWELWIADESSYRIGASARRTQLNMKGRLIDTVLSAIERRFGLVGLDAVYDPESQYEFALRLFGGVGTISINTSGEHLHKRGYKLYSVPAPIRETLAASILLTLNYQKYDYIIDPFCGSGTFILEAARMSMKTPPGLYREFAFFQSPFFSERKMSSTRKLLAEQGGERTATKFYGFDISESALMAARENARLAGLADLVRFAKCDFRDIDFSRFGSIEDHRLLVSNPPYGLRLNLPTNAEVRSIESLHANLKGWTIAIIRPNQHAESTLDKWPDGSHRHDTYAFKNGGLQAYLHVFLPAERCPNPDG